MAKTLEAKTEIGNGKIPTKDQDLVTCPITYEQCPMRGDYYKCYFNHHDTCETYKRRTQ